VFLGFLWLFLGPFVHQEYHTPDSKGVAVFIILIFSLMSYRTVWLIITQRFNFEILEDKITVIDMLIRKKKELTYDSIKGYSLGILKTKVPDWKEIVIYCNDGKIYQIPQYGFFNFKTLKTSITRNVKMNYLGEEGIDYTFEGAFKRLTSRQYRFE
jgi:hypothetical protein